MATNPVAAYAKDPSAVLDYVWDWTEYLNGDTIATSAFTLASGIADAGHFISSTKTVIFISGGTNGQSYIVTNAITTVGGRTDQRSIQINVVLR